jgi:hypothetical protein
LDELEGGADEADEADEAEEWWPCAKVTFA